MPNQILQQFLDRRLIDVGEDAAKFEHLTRAADELAETLSNDRRTLLTASAVLLADRLVEGEPLTALCQDAIKRQWPTYLSRFPTAPLQLFRGALMQALSNVGFGPDPAHAAIIYYTGTSLLPFASPIHDNVILRDLLLELGKKNEIEAMKYWATGASSDEVTYNAAGIAIPPIKIKTLADMLRNSAGPSGAAGANPEWPSANTVTWLEHYGKASAEAVATSVTEVLKALVPTLIERTRDDNQMLRDAIERARGGKADALRADLLYWRATLFSASQETSYRQLPPDVAIYWLARDLCRLSPRFHPQSTEFFLRETVRHALGDTETGKQKTVREFLAALANQPTIGAASHSATSSVTLLDAAHATARGALDATDASVQVGISVNTSLTREDLAVWLFRDMQASRLATTEGRP